MNPIFDILSIMTQGTMGGLIAIAIILIFSIAITRKWEKAMLIFLPITIGLMTIGVGTGNEIMPLVVLLGIIMYAIGFLYENRLIAPRLSSKGLSLAEATANLVAKGGRGTFGMVKETKQKAETVRGTGLEENLARLGTYTPSQVDIVEKQSKLAQRIKRLREQE